VHGADQDLSVGWNIFGYEMFSSYCEGIGSDEIGYTSVCCGLMPEKRADVEQKAARFYATVVGNTSKEAKKMRIH